MTAQDPTTAHAEFVKGLWKENPVLVQVLGMCPALAVTNTAVNALAMGVMTLSVLAGSALLVSLARNLVPKQVRISVFIIIIATFVTVADYLLKAVAPAVHKELGAFIALIVVNCIVLGRMEAFASKNRVGKSVADAVGMGLGFTFALLLLGGLREVLGSGSLFGVDVMGPSFEPWVVMILPPGGFIMLGLILLALNALAERRKRRMTPATEDALDGSRRAA